jgi:ribosome-binding factor A
METNRQKKISGVLQNDLTIILQKLIKNSGKSSIICSVTKVKISTDLSLAKVYVSIFPVAQVKSIFELITQGQNLIRKSLGSLIKNQVRRIPDLAFYIDDSLEQISEIEKALKGSSNPIKDATLLSKRKSI